MVHRLVIDVVAASGAAFAVAVDAHGEARPGWKLLRVLANKLELEGYQFETIDDVRTDMLSKSPNETGSNKLNLNGQSLPDTSSLQRISDIPMNSADAFVRRAESLQKTSDVADGVVRINSKLAESLGLDDVTEVVATQSEKSVTLPLNVDDRVADDCVLIQAKHDTSSALGSWFGEISLGKG